MDAIIMHSTTSLLEKIKSDFKDIHFKQSDTFSWSPADNTICYDKLAKNQDIMLLHELSHAILSHKKYDRDINLIVMERQAWDKASELAIKYGVEIPEQTIESSLDSYRDWIHARSTCTNCTATGMQVSQNTYSCPSCQNQWKVNEARSCALRRYKI
jgi:hypothetical protein